MLDVRSLSKRYGSRAALDNVSLTLPTGCLAVLLGPNGAGKSALFQVLTGLFAADAGEVLVAGLDLRQRVPYDVYIAPGLVGMVLLFNGMQSSLAMVYDREMGLMRLLLTAPLPRPWILFAKLCATAVLSLVQAVAFVIIAALLGTVLPVWGAHTPMVLLAAVSAALMLGALGLLLSVHIKQLENFADTMNFVIFPMYFMSTALYPLWKLEESGAGWVYQVARFNPFTHAVEWLRFALYGKDAGISPWVVLGTLLLRFGLASWDYAIRSADSVLSKRPAGAA